MASTELRIAGIVNDSIVDGEGYRFTIFTQGCPHHCPGCHNPQTHSFDGGHMTNIEDLYQKITENPLLSGVTFSGGEPFCQPEPLTELAKRLHQIHLDIWIYTGYTLEQLQSRPEPAIHSLLAAADVLVDGAFHLAERDLTLAFRGSRNQRVIDMNATRTAGHMVEKPVDIS
jgi:anaerobic ribonucleoside-triphosphate reductase activating protein